jgi:hypothetical protein
VALAVWRGARAKDVCGPQKYGGRFSLSRGCARGPARAEDKNRWELRRPSPGAREYLSILVLGSILRALRLSRLAVASARMSGLSRHVSRVTASPRFRLFSSHLTTGISLSVSYCLTHLSLLTALHTYVRLTETQLTTARPHTPLPEERLQRHLNTHGRSDSQRGRRTLRVCTDVDGSQKLS